MKRLQLPTCDWQASLSRGHRHRERLGWIGAAAAVAGMTAATAALAMQLDQNNGQDVQEEAILINMEPPAPALAMSAPAPDVPQTEAPTDPEMVEDTPEPPPEPIAEDEPLPEPEEIAELPDPVTDEVALPDAPPPPPPRVKPRERPERVVEEKPREEPRRERRAPPPSQASAAAAPQATGTSQSAISAGQAQQLEIRWGSQIRARIERRIRSSRERGTVTVRIVVTPAGQLAAVGIAGSSGNPALDQRAVQTVQSAASGFPSAPAGLTNPSYTFTLPVTFK